MSVQESHYRGDAAPNIIAGNRRRRTAASYERELTLHRCTESRLRETLLRQEQELIQQQETLSKLFAARENAMNRMASLSPRQVQIMDLVLGGHPSKNIAADLGISKRTVENHRAIIMKKTGSTSLPALARLALVVAWNGPDKNLIQRELPALVVPRISLRKIGSSYDCPSNEGLRT